ncbi:hypothetical protein CRG98_010261 [Punica granatum]|uniref:Integrase catalytic domain-containing protein n=1 Tax=Punica granatum TaxID=22663 RepID=A0A2I0KLE1_PUNGR|nr:hypothetical protein CRG98_010261 [Punica granatum]
MGKKIGIVRVCVDYQDLNKASLKDNFPLPHIDVLVDNTAHHTQFSFMDCFFGYNQIRMAEEDKTKTTFITMWGTFCYRVMPFGLKNVDATYQRAMVMLFHDMMLKEIEVYVDGIIAKSKEGEDHLVNLKRLFDPLKKYKLRLNRAKCTFGAKSGNCWDPWLANVALSNRVGLVPPTPDRHLIIYLIVRRQSLGCMLGQEDESTHRLRQYTLYHNIRLLSKADPLKYLLDSPSSTGNITKWRCQLTEYDINADIPRRALLPLATKTDFPYTNNVADYEACILDLQAGIDFKNQFPDSLATFASMVSITKENLIEPLEIEIAEDPTDCDAIEATDRKPLYKDIKHFLQIGHYLAFANHYDRKILRRLAAHYFLSGKTLYRHSFDATLLRCVDENEAQCLMEEDIDVNGPISPKASNGYLFILVAIDYFTKLIEAVALASVTVKAVARFLKRDIMEEAQCLMEQCLMKEIKAPPNELHRMAAPWPFLMWGIDVIVPISPKASNRYLFILVAIDYFTKLIEAVTLASVTAKAVARFLKRDIIARYEVPATIITDNVKNLNNRIIDELCAQFKIQHRNSIPYRP